MIDEKKIEETARNRVNVFRKANPDGYSSTIIDIESNCLDNFKQGANWAIKEFLQDLWHDASEEPEKNKLIIEEYLEEYGYNYEIDCLTNSHRTWVEMVKVYGIRKWCYLDDILPQKGGSDV